MYEFLWGLQGLDFVTDLASKFKESQCLEAAWTSCYLEDIVSSDFSLCERMISIVTFIRWRQTETDRERKRDRSFTLSPHHVLFCTVILPDCPCASNDEYYLKRLPMRVPLCVKGRIITCGSLSLFRATADMILDPILTQTAWAECALSLCLGSFMGKDMLIPRIIAREFLECMSKNIIFEGIISQMRNDLWKNGRTLKKLKKKLEEN